MMQTGFPQSVMAALALAGAATPPAVAEPAPIFPYFYGKFPGHEERVKELGYTPMPHLLTQLNCQKEPAYNFEHVSHWIRVMAKGGPGFVFVKIDDAGDEEKAIRLIHQTADVAAEAGFTVVLYPYTGTVVDTAERALPLLQRIAHPRVGLTLHLPQEIKGGNARRFPEIVARVKDHIRLVVVCGADLPGEGDDPLQWPWSRLIRPLGEGSFDVGAFVQTVRDAGYSGPFGQICWGMEGSAPDYLESSMAAWKKWMPETTDRQNGR